MSKLPQVNVRLAPEHHGLIREIAQRLRADPSLAAGIADFLAQTSPRNQPQVSPLPHGLADEVAELKERLEESRDLTLTLQERFHFQSEGLRKTTAYADNINERVKVLEKQLADLGQKPASASLDAVEATDMPVLTEALPEPPQERQTRKPPRKRKKATPPPPA